MTALPYVTSPGNIEKALNAIKSAAVPERVTQDFVKTILKIKGGSGAQMASQTLQEPQLIGIGVFEILALQGLL